MDQVKMLIDNIASYKQSWEIASECDKFFDQLSRTEKGEDLLSRYRLNLFQIQEINAENARLTNFASTRMSRVQQNLNEEYLVFTSFCDQLRNIPKIGAELDEVNKRLKDIERFALQTELAMLCLESVHNTLLQKEFSSKDIL
uniref:Uncharacterized protein n=1 Tax=Ditylenchus dipsaci TaxID=166011 RepID=A0A915DEU3_9BILA